ncbi:MAG: hypothetical protein ACI9YE_000016 [Psychroserpens sp.]
MFIVKLVGGLGNQMFQYAFARHLAMINGEILKIDLSELNLCKLREYSLQNFNIKEVFSSNSDLDVVVEFKEKHFHFDETFKDIIGDVLLTGYWQTEKYFIDIDNVIRSEFIVKSKLTGKNLAVSQLILDSNSVSLHIRRSDYTLGSYKDQIFDSLGIDYYQSAIADLSNKENDLKLFIFSDDLKWVKQNIKLNLPTVYVDHNSAETCHEDLRLMSLCKHNIIANSSFSWWGAWLNSNPTKKVYAPIRWFNSNSRNLDSKDIIPKSWIKV